MRERGPGSEDGGAGLMAAVSVGAVALLVLDGAGWHSSPRLNVPENIVCRDTAEGRSDCCLRCQQHARRVRPSPGDRKGTGWWR
jgi:hypothetical protein